MESLAVPFVLFYFIALVIWYLSPYIFKVTDSDKD